MANLIPPIPLNNPIYWQLAFLDENSNPFDPDSGIQIVVNDGYGNVTVLTYTEGGDSQLTRISEGVYQGVSQATVPGDWIAYGQGTITDGPTITTADAVQTVSETQVAT